METITINNKERAIKSVNIPDNEIKNIEIIVEIKNYEVTYNTNEGFKCNCPDHTYRHTQCKHILKVIPYINKQLKKAYITALQQKE